MCETLKYENVQEGIGTIIAIPYRKELIGVVLPPKWKYSYQCISGVPYQDKEGNKGIGVWLGHKRSEKPAPKNSKEVVIIVTSYTEENIEFSVPAGYGIKAYLVCDENFQCNRHKGLFIVTRAATKEELARCKHSRHPVFTKV